MSLSLMRMGFEAAQNSRIQLEAVYTGVEDGKPDTKEAIAYRDFLKKATK